LNAKRTFANIPAASISSIEHFWALFNPLNSDHDRPDIDQFASKEVKKFHTSPLLILILAVGIIVHVILE